MGWTSPRNRYPRSNSSETLKPLSPRCSSYRNGNHCVGSTLPDQIKTRGRAWKCSNAEHMDGCSRVLRAEGLTASHSRAHPCPHRACLDMARVFSIYEGVEKLLNKVWKTTEP